MDKLKLGFAMTGSFCTWAKVLPVMEELAGIYDVFPSLSPISYVSDNRFGRAADWLERIERACGRKAWHTIEEVEPIGPKNLLDAMVIVPCTGNTLGKLANGVNDTPVTMAESAQREPAFAGGVDQRRALRFGAQHRRADERQKRLFRPHVAGRPGQKADLGGGALRQGGRGARGRAGGKAAPAGLRVNL